MKITYWPEGATTVYRSDLAEDSGEIKVFSTIHGGEEYTERLNEAYFEPRDRNVKGMSFHTYYEFQAEGTYNGQKCTLYFNSTEKAENNYTFFADEAGFPLGYKNIKNPSEVNMSYVAGKVLLDEFKLDRKPSLSFDDVRIYTAPEVTICPDSSSGSASSVGSKSSGSTSTGPIQMVSNILLVVAFVLFLFIL